MKRKIKFVVTAARWFDRVNGNTYHACQVTRCRDGAVLRCPWQYGYGDQYRYTALEAMAAAKWIPPRYRQKQPHGDLACMSYERENGYPILWNVTDGRKRDMVALGQE